MYLAEAFQILESMMKSLFIKQEKSVLIGHGASLGPKSKDSSTVLRGYDSCSDRVQLLAIHGIENEIGIGPANESCHVLVL